MNTCNIEGCGKPTLARGWCANHYARWYRRGGDPSQQFGGTETNSGNLRERFDRKWKLDDITGCWEWIGVVVGPSDRPCMAIANRRQYAHRVAWDIYKGKRPENLYVLHNCDNMNCVNPDHLYLGSKQQNSSDMSRRERAGQAKLSRDEVEFIRTSTLGTAALSRKFNVGKLCIQNCRNRKTYKEWL